MSPPCCVSAFPNNSSRVLPFYFPWNFRIDWACVTFVSCCVTSKWSNIFKLSTRPCKLSQQYQEVKLDKILLSVRGRCWQPSCSFILGVQGPEWDRTESLWRGQAIYTHKDLKKQNPIKHKTPKLRNFGNQMTSVCFSVTPVWLRECKLWNLNLTKKKKKKDWLANCYEYSYSTLLYCNYFS